jgi:ubiquinol-cytochrome c reductase cytochrome b subunit
MAKGLVNWLDARMGCSELTPCRFTEWRVPADVSIFQTLGITALVGLILQVVSGAFLLVYYVPHPEYAFRSVQDIMTVVPYGWFVRLVHSVGSNLLVAVVLLHLLTVCVMGSYGKPRELTWVTGSVLLLAVLGFCFTGYLLPWSQLSYWATTIMVTMPTYFPFFGEYLVEILRGGDTISGASLNRFFALHVGLLPLLCAVLGGLHVLLVRRIGIFGGSGAETAVAERPKESGGEGMLFYPDFITRAGVIVMIYCAVMFFVITFVPTLFLPEDAVAPANPYKTPLHVRPQWYFLAPYQLLKLVPNKFLAACLEVIVLALFVLWPFLDRKGGANVFSRPVLRFLLPALAGLWIILTAWGSY